MKIRTANAQTDLAAIARLVSPYEAIPLTTGEVRAWFEHTSPGRLACRLVAVDENDAVVGYAVVVHEISMPAGQFYAWLVVEPAQRGQGVGSALWEVSRIFLGEQSAARLKSEVHEDDPAGLAFATQRGFAIDRHVFGSSLDLITFDESPYLPVIAALEAQGIRFGSLADFPDTPEVRRKHHDLNLVNALDTPGVEETPWTYEQFQELIVRAPWFRREGQLLAVDGDTWAGLSAVSLNPEDHSAYNAHTGVLQAYRGRKIAQALKVLAIRYARQHGARVICTHNDSLNAPILTINRKLGYRPEPGKLLLSAGF